MQKIGISYSVLDEPTEIAFVSRANDPSDQVRIGFDGVTSIIIYNENGEMAPVPWIAVYKGKTCHRRMPLRFWEVNYKSE